MGSWRDEQRLVEDKLNRQETALQALAARQTQNEIDIAVLKAKAGVYGAIAGFAAAFIVKYFFKV